MKTLASLVLLGGVLMAGTLFVGDAEARTVVRTGEYISLGNEQEIEGNFYALGNTISVSGSIMGDVHAVAASITLNGPVRDDVFFVGGTVALHASTSEDVRIIAGDVTIADAIGGSLAVMGGRVKILSTATIAGDVLIYGGDVTIEGMVTGQVLGNMTQLRIDGAVAGGVDVVVGTLTLGERADVTGDIRYQSSNEILRSPGAVIAGELVPVAPSVLPVANSVAKVYAICFLVLLFTTLTFFLLARSAIEKLMQMVVLRTLHYGLIGGAGFVFLPVVASVLIASILGAVVGMVVGGVFVVMVLVAIPLTIIFVGNLAMLVISKKSTVSITTVLLGTTLVFLLLLVPVLGFLVVLCALFCVLGALLWSLYNALRSVRG